MSLHRIIAALLLMAHAVTGTSLIPGTMAALADLEGSHQGMISFGRGETRVILHHRTDDYTPAVGDHQRCLARLIVRFCRAGQGGDHQITTAGVNGSLDEKRHEAGRIRSIHELTNLPATHAWLSTQPASQTAFLRERPCARRPRPSQMLPSILTVRILV